MDKQEMEEAGRFVRNSSVNVQLEFALSIEGEQLFCLRAIPWRNSSKPNRMILVGSDDLVDALVLLAVELDQQNWVELDWKARPLEAGVYEPEIRNISSLKNRADLLRQRSQAAKRDGTEYPGPEDNVPF
jgi:hypothetical protein